ncbi:PTS transporter subunit EIIC [Companilactobacillus sp. DQM5]|uniref:PTS transporter subunit EIIC n=1 Tax=Companilactobacillus sp. DQM5 TaxID=3463359 RepID=UPI004058C9A4
MKSDQVAEEILNSVGGKNNIEANVACMTRLRLQVKDKNKVNIENLKKVEGVLAVVDADTLQVVLGPGKVNKVAEPFSKLSEVALGYEDDDNSEVDSVDEIAKNNKKQNKEKHDKPLQRGLQHIANVFIPLLPGIIAAGLINGLTNVIDFQTHGSLMNQWWYMTIKSIGWGLFTFLPIFVGMNAAREFKGTAILGGIGGTICLSIAVPGFPLLTKGVIMPLTNKPFTVGVGGLITALFMGIFFAYLEKNIRKVMPDLLDTFFTPLLTVLIGALLAVVVLQPAGSWLTNGIYIVMDFIYSKLGILGGFLLSASFLPLVSVGLHQALTPIHVLLNDPNGPTKGINYLLPILMTAGGGQVGAALALFFKTKNKKLKKLAMNSIPVAFLGVGEPLMYAITLPLGRSFITACIGSGLGGIVASLFHLGAVSQGVSGLFGLLIMQPGQQIQFLIAMILAYIGGFLCTWFFGVDEERINEVFGK